MAGFMGLRASLGYIAPDLTQPISASVSAAASLPVGGILPEVSTETSLLWPGARVESALETRADARVERSTPPDRLSGLWHATHRVESSIIGGLNSSARPTAGAKKNAIARLRSLETT